MTRFIVRRKRDAREALQMPGRENRPLMVVQNGWWNPTSEMHASQVYPPMFSQAIAAVALALRSKP